MQAFPYRLDQDIIFGSVASCKVSNRRYTLIWTIHNLCKFRNSLVRYKEFSILSDVMWSMEASVQNKYLYYVHTIIYIKAYRVVKTNFQLSVFDSRNRRVQHTSFPDASVYGTRNWFTIDVSHLTDINPIFVFEINVIETNVVTEINKWKLPTVDGLDTPKKFSADLESIFRNPRYSDVTLLVNGITMLAHKTILSARSPVFSNLLSSQLELGSRRQNHNNHERNLPGRCTLVIDDISSSTLKTLVEYLYTSHVRDIDFEEAYALYAAAHKYGVKDLHEICARILFYKLDLKNPCRVWFLADQYSDLKLKQSVQYFILSHLDSLTSMDRWFELITKCTKLSEEVLFNTNEHFQR